ncbi:hypothetical protein AGMMS49965_26300 [Bacteroidia bacterium]|nr:hypothetical protein AGMMS49965_26300 [Bacteroidia bacterium]
MKNCIYIHGLESGGNSRTASILRKEFAGVLNIIEPKIDYTNMQSVVATIKEAMTTHPACFLIGSSMGGFVALQFPDTPKILINPALHPTEIDIVKRHPHLQSQLPVFLEMEKFVVEREKLNADNGDREDAEFTYGLFGLNDELFSFRAEFEQNFSYTLMSSNIFTCSDGHRLSEETVRKELKALIEYYLIESALFEATYPYIDMDDTEAWREGGFEPPRKELFAQLIAEKEKILAKLK